MVTSYDDRLLDDIRLDFQIFGETPRAEHV